MAVLLAAAALLALQHGAVVSAEICSGPPASPNWYGSAGYPPYFTRDSEENCPQKYELSRCEQSAVMKDGTADFATDENGVEVCNAPVDCFPTKQNCNDTLTCSDLLGLRDDLEAGGHNIVCRHEKTYWQMYPGEVKNCHAHANCLDPAVAPTQRQLQQFGWRSAEAFAGALKAVGVPVGRAYASPFTRCSAHADFFAPDGKAEDRLELLYMGGWKEAAKLNGLANATKPDALKWQAYSLRNFAGKRPAPGTNNVMVTHGFNIKLSFGLAVDEGYCVVLKPALEEPSLADSVGTLTVANKEFVFDGDAFPVDAIARMSPESAIHMQSCHDVQRAASDDEEPKGILAYDSDGDMRITRDEFIAAHGAPDGDAAFDFLARLQPSALGRDLPSAGVLELGRFFHRNWGWREFAGSGGAVSLPWRGVVEDTIGEGGDSPAERVAAFERANAPLSILAAALREGGVDYPSADAAEEALLKCDRPSNEDRLRACLEAGRGGGKYFPVGPGDGGASAGTNSIMGAALAYPTLWVPDEDLYDDKYARALSCLVSRGEVSLAEVLQEMGCEDKIDAVDTEQPGPAASFSNDALEVIEECPNTPVILAIIFAALFVVTAVIAYLQHKEKVGAKGTGHVSTGEEKIGAGGTGHVTEGTGHVSNA